MFRVEGEEVFVSGDDGFMILEGGLGFRGKASRPLACNDVGCHESNSLAKFICIKPPANPWVLRQAS